MRARMDAPVAMFGALPAAAGGMRRRLVLGVSAIAHAAALTLLVLGPLVTQEALPAAPDYLRGRLLPPPPPLPPLAGSPTAPATATTRSAPSTPVESTALRLPEDTPPIEPARPSPAPEQGIEAWGSPAGSDAGHIAGMDGGVPEGELGGVPNGQPGGEIGADGNLPAPVRDYDRPPRLLTQIKPVYPPDAFTRKIEGTVLTEILIGTDGHVLRARVVKSVPELDAAALAAVRLWTFAPAVKNGRPVPTVATAPVSFRIY